MEINNITTPEDIFLWMDENMQYGWLYLEGSRHVGEMKNFREQYQTMSVKETLEHKIGTCIEQAEVMHYLLDKINIKNKMFCCRIYEPDDYGNLEEEEHMHCFVLFWRDGKVYHIELRGGKESPTTQFYSVPAGIYFKEYNAFINKLKN